MKILYEDGDAKIYMNPSAEIFIENKKTNVTLRIDINRRHTLVTFGAARANPSSINGLPAFTFTKD